MRRLYIICMLALAGCATEIDPPPAPPVPPESGNEVTVTFNFDVDNPVAATRAVDENAVSKIQLLLIGENGQRYYFVPGNEKFVAASIKRGKYEVYAVANYADIIKDYPASRLAGLTATHKDSDDNIVMSFRSVADFTQGSSSSYSIKLIRTVAKLRFSIATAANMTITRLSLRNAPGQTKLFPQPNPGTNFTTRELGIPADGIFTVYIPENLAGTVPTIKDQKQRTAVNAPAKATYLLIEGEITTNTASNSFERKKFESVVYLGGNTTSDFNVRRNTDYRIDVNIAEDLSNDYRIEVALVGHEVVVTMTRDGKYVVQKDGEIRLKPFFRADGSNSGKKVTYKYVFEDIESSNFVIAGKTLTDNTYSGTLTAGETHSLMFSCRVAPYTSQKCRVRYTLTFTDENGGTTVYSDEFRYANKMYVFVPKKGGVPKADVKFPPNASVVEIGDTSSGCYYETHYPDDPIEITIIPRPGYTFKGWYASIKYKDLFSTSPTYSYRFPGKFGSICAKVE